MKKQKYISILLFAVVVLQIGCLSNLQFEPRNDDPKFRLGQEYFVHLDSTWTTEQADKLLKIFNSISPDETEQTSIWKISDADLQNDINIETQVGLTVVTISRDVCVVDESQSASLSDKRLFKAAVQFITANGRNNDDPKFRLGQEYFVRLDSTWTTEYADRLLKIFNSISPDETEQTSIWKISNAYLQNDINIETQVGLTVVTISRDVCVVDESQSASLSDKRLFKAVVQFMTANGTNRPAIKRILYKRYGISVDVSSDIKKHVMLPAYAAYKITPKGFSAIDNEDLIIFISILEDFPQALHKIPQLRYVVCRDEDLGAGAVAKAWTISGFIEFKKSVLDNAPISVIHKILVHEKSHFIWKHLLSTQLKEDWIKLGGWYQNPESEHGWSTNKKRAEFVTDYAFMKNPDEDMADSLAYYFVYPNKLRACNMAKYNFIHERIIKSKTAS